MVENREQSTSLAMHGAYQQLASCPTPETYARLRGWFITCPDYDPYRDDLRDIERQVACGQFAAAGKALECSMPSLVLSPRAHYLAARIACQSGDMPRAELECRIAEACVEGILNTGDGSREHPYQILYALDEQDVLDFLGLPQNRPRLHHIEGLHLDRIEVAEGVEVWFDITEAYHRQTPASVMEQLKAALRDP